MEDSKKDENLDSRKKEEEIISDFIEKKNVLKKEKIYIGKFIYSESISIPPSYHNQFFFAFFGTKYPFGDQIYVLIRAPTLSKSKNGHDTLHFNPIFFSLKIAEFYELVFGEKFKDINDFKVKFWNNLFWLIDGFWTHSEVAPDILKNPFSKALQIDLHCLISQYKQLTNQGCKYPFCLPMNVRPKNDLNGLNAKDYSMSDVFLIPTYNPSIWIPLRSINVSLVWPHFKDNTIPEKIIHVDNNHIKILFCSTLDQNNVLKSYSEPKKGNKRIEPIDNSGSNRLVVEDCLQQLEMLKNEERIIFMNKPNVSVLNRLIRHWLYYFHDLPHQDDPIISNYVTHESESKIFGYQTKQLDLTIINKWFYNPDNLKKVLETSFGQLEKYPIHFSHFEIFWKNLIEEITKYSMPANFEIRESKITFALFICLTSLIELFILNNSDFIEQNFTIENPKLFPSSQNPKSEIAVNPL